MLAGCSPKTAPQRQTSAPAPEVTQFYTNKPLLPKGETALLCYGVANAAAVRIDPPVEKLAPALTRCFEVTPAQTTKYTLTADGRDGRTASREVTIQIGGALPKLTDVSVNALKIKRGQRVTFCFKAKNATSVRIGPGRLVGTGNPSGDCVIDIPAKSTTYTVTVSNAGGSDTANATVEVIP